MQKNELPAWMLEENQVIAKRRGRRPYMKVQELLERKGGTEGPRARKDIRYSEDMSEAQFLKVRPCIPV